MPDTARTIHEKLLTSAAGLARSITPDDEAVANLITVLNQVDTEKFLSLAQWHGLGLILYYLLKPTWAELKPGLRLSLQGIYLQHRDLSAAQSQTLAEIVSEAEDAGLDLLLLKGAALGPQVYTPPVLRPMSDLDLLVRPEQVRLATEVLAIAGFNPPRLPYGRGQSIGQINLPQIRREVNGQNVIVELHQSLSMPRMPGRDNLDHLWSKPLSFELTPGGARANTLAPEEMLWHLCNHLCEHAVYRVRLIWMLDIVLYAERYCDKLDWPSLEDDAPLVKNTLSLLDRIWPLSDKLRRWVKIHSGRQLTPDLRNWPIPWNSALNELGAVPFLRGLFFPSAWWLRLYHGLGPSKTIWLHRWFLHPLHMTWRICKHFSPMS